MADISFVQRIVNAAATATAFIWNGGATFKGAFTVDKTTASLKVQERVGATTEMAVYGNIATPSNTNYSIRFTASGNSTQLNGIQSTFMRANDVAIFAAVPTAAYTMTGIPLGIGTNAAPVASAMVEMTSTTKGVLWPRMTRAQRVAIASPADFLGVVQTNNDAGSGDNAGLWIYNPLKSGGAGWDRLAFVSEI